MWEEGTTEYTEYTEKKEITQANLDVFADRFDIKSSETDGDLFD